MKLGIKAEEIMEENFPLLDASLTLEDCIRKLNKKHEICLILNKGYLYSVLSYDDLLRALFKRREKNLKLIEIKAKRNFVIISPETDVIDAIELMKRKNIDFLIVKTENSFGVITKEKLAEINILIFDKVKKRIWG